ncbi:hypothetical protein LNQ81_03675 [Myroides sp. M-43]|uniref:hypothetical protein n=1 Tax=Myroides oncorhynchi TaxID=2893756 RepID=UPI001E5656F6|nr:hypothetical protein [Myroides oncorhynchi]
MKKYLFIIVTLLVFRPVVPLVDYLIDYEYISTVLCINTDKPEMHCNGQCYLMKELARTVKEEQHKDGAKKVCNIAFALMYVGELQNYIAVNTSLAHSNKTLDQYSDLYRQLFTYRVLRPPVV